MNFLLDYFQNTLLFDYMKDYYFIKLNKIKHDKNHIILYFYIAISAEIGSLCMISAGIRSDVGVDDSSWSPK
jgi:hypothetical protein